MKKNKFLYGVFLVSFVLFLLPRSFFAEEETSNLGYSVSALLNGKQIDPEKSYFYLQTAPEEKQELTVKVKSTQKEAVKLKVYLTDAFTGGNGAIEYTADKELLDSTLINPISSIVKVATPNVTVGNYEEKDVSFILSPPKEHYSGVKMGALVFEVDDSDNEEMVSSKFAYRIGLMTAEDGDDYRNSKTLNLIEAKSTIKRGKKLVLATLQNPEPKILNDLKIEAEVRKKENQAIVNKKSVDNYLLAPNSHFDFELDWGTTDVKAGTYLLNVKATNGYDDWVFEKEFVITGAQAKKMNQESSFKIVTPTWIKVGTVLCFIVMVAILSWILIRRKKMEIEWKDRRRKNKQKRKKKKEGE